VAAATNEARALIELPGNIATPERLAAEARKLAKLEQIQVRILDERGLRRERMHALIAVGQGSAAKPRFIVVEYRGTADMDRPIVLIGKGITFDTGGVNLKNSKNIENMNYDKSGGVSVLAALRAAATLGLPLNVVGLVPAAENMVSGSAMRPGDVIRTRAGKTVEINNTDAEGRLVLADALDYARKYRPAAVIDIATLTGACVVALGEETIGMLGSSEQVKSRLVAAGETVHERVWELPLWDEHEQEMKSEIADLKNSGGSAGGAITAAAFLRPFVGDAPWAHLDIAGPAWAKTAKGYVPKGATAAGTRLLIQFLRDWAQTTGVRAPAEPGKAAPALKSRR
jgi:leucyl aminopeptidase